MHTDTVKTTQNGQSEPPQDTVDQSSDEGTPLFDEILHRNGVSWLDDGTETVAEHPEPDETGEAAAPAAAEQPDTAPAGAHARPEPSESDGQVSTPAPH